MVELFLFLPITKERRNYESVLDFIQGDNNTFICEVIDTPQQKPVEAVKVR